MLDAICNEYLGTSALTSSSENNSTYSFKFSSSSQLREILSFNYALLFEAIEFFPVSFVEGLALLFSFSFPPLSVATQFFL